MQVIRGDALLISVLACVSREVEVSGMHGIKMGQRGLPQSGFRRGGRIERRDHFVLREDAFQSGGR